MLENGKYTLEAVRIIDTCQVLGFIESVDVLAV